MKSEPYTVGSVAQRLREKLAQYIEAQYHIWDESLVRDRRRLLDARNVISREPFIEATPAYVYGAPYSQLELPQEVLMLLQLAADAKDSKTGIPKTPYAHQTKALEAFFRDALDLVISTGTGSGKTESFLMPILGSLALERAQRPASYARPGVRALLIYPMNALVNDQLARLRRIFSSRSVTTALKRANGRCATFGVYTSRTPYPGPYDKARTEREVGDWIDHFFLRYQNFKDRLLDEGKWPAKDLAAFRATFQTSPEDGELLTRHEMQSRAPDVLITNYSMLEYMLLRPVDAPIFDATRAWLEADGTNSLLVVLDEAHLYQGAQGTEVALLLRRLGSRLRVPRDRLRFIMTSASLSEGPDAARVIRAFAEQLTGVAHPDRPVAVIQGDLDRPKERRPATSAEAKALAALPVDVLVSADSDPTAVGPVLSQLASDLKSARHCSSASLTELRDEAYSLMAATPVSAALAHEVMGHPAPLSELAHRLFPTEDDPIPCLDGLLAVCAFAKREVDGRIFVSSRAHLLFRGLDGVFACVNPRCTAREQPSDGAILGKLYSRPRLRCDCGSRVYELLTHRDCGAAFLRGYSTSASGDFLWHEPSTGVAAQAPGLYEIHFLVERSRDQLGGGNQVWLHRTTGQLERRAPRGLEGFIEVTEPTAQPVLVAGRNVVTFGRQCPVCLGRWRLPNQPKIMDLVTKGEDPFAYLIATQVQVQPLSAPVTPVTPNGGRKTLLFSDGRQKAARLARDVPRVIEQDAFRQILLLSAQRLGTADREARLSDGYIYTAFLGCVGDLNLRFFDGDDTLRFRDQLRQLQRMYRGDISKAIEDGWTPTPVPPFRVGVLRTLGSSYYSICALGLGYVEPRRLLAENLRTDLKACGLSDEDAHALSVAWVRGMLEDFALYRTEAANRRVRELAAGYPVPVVGSESGFTSVQKGFLRNAVDLTRLETAFREHLTEIGSSPQHWVIPHDAVVIVPSLSQTWFRCEACTHLSPVTWRGSCVGCGQAKVRKVLPRTDEYMRARKSFWRDPVERVLRGEESPMTLDVEEHTAQLGYRDLGELESTTESFERRFRDILIDNEEAIDVLSCTTTMEVGIDIGSLIAVGLRNMPPSRHNYQQRAGRAGRRGTAVSTVVSFAQNNPHDSDLFENPARLIGGRPSVTGLDLGNRVLAERHAFAELLQEYFSDAVIRKVGGSVFAALGQTQPFFSSNSEGSLAHLATWLQTEEAAAATLQRLNSWLPPATRLSGADCAKGLIETLEKLRVLASQPLPRGEEQLIEFLFAHGVLPAYAFPRDLVTLQIENQDANGQITVIQRPQQAAHIALSEYAPGRLVVVNKRTYRVGAVTAPTTPDTLNRAAKLFENPQQYIQCPNCLYTAVPSSPGGAQVGSNCPTCAAAALALVTVIQPEIVWPEGKAPLDELDDEQTLTDTTIAQLPVPASDTAFEHKRPFGSGSHLSHGRKVPLVMMNRGTPTASGPSGFVVCERCGHATVGAQDFTTRHLRHYELPRRRGVPRPSAFCTGQGHLVYLGYQFTTDVLLLRTVLKSPFAHDLSDRSAFGALRDALNSLSNGLALTAASELDIDARELQCGYRLQRTAAGESMADLYLYDTLAGGAGYSSLIGEHFAEIFEATRARLAECSCQSSCTECLRTYGNRLYHHALDRRLALDLADYCVRGATPVLFSGKEQARYATPLREMLEMRGFSTAESAGFAFNAKISGVSVDVGIVPTLYDPKALSPSWDNVTVFAVREVERDLPSCLSRVGS